MQVNKNVSLQAYNTFGIKTACGELVILESKADIEKAFDLFPQSLIIGGGSNILLAKNPIHSVILNRITGIKIISENDKGVQVSVGSGHNWHEFVRWAVSQNLGGIENLSLIPGTVGAGPIQNIGAYGTEIKDVLEKVEFYDFEKRKFLSLLPEQCHFGYRDSVFKNDLKNKGFISQVFFNLTKSSYYEVNLSYKGLTDYLNNLNIKSPTITEVSNAVISIRQSKLPDWKELGNAGSFFKNPEINIDLFKKIKQSYPEAPSYPIDSKTIKIPAAWLIETCGFKGVQYGNVGCYLNQPLVIVNYGNALPAEIIDLKNHIQNQVLDKFGIELVPEVTIVQ